MASTKLTILTCDLTRFTKSVRRGTIMIVDKFNGKESAMKFYKCDKCGKIIAIVKETAVPTVCCGEAMRELIAGEIDAAAEKHVPVATRDGNKLTVAIGSQPHPMVENHYIEWIALETRKGNQRVILTSDKEPVAEFAILPGDEPKTAYAYCNLHGLWKADL